MQPHRDARRVRPTLGRGFAALAIATAVATVAVGEPGRADADTTVVYDEAGDASHIGLIGDSSLSGVRWYDDYGDLQRYNFVFDAESCRRTLETSCWSREQYRAETALQTMQRLSGSWGEVLVMMTGYNDASFGFDDAVEAILAEAKAQGIPQVVWLTFPTSDVNYEEPLHRANGATYGENNQLLLDAAAESDGYLQVADWAAHSAGQLSWFEYDGVHLTVEGVDGVTNFIANQVERVLAGANVTPPAPPWGTMEEGDSGSRVTRIQEALMDGGFDVVGGVDGAFGGLTAEGVRAFQQRRGLAVTGEVDQSTAVALGIYEVPEAPEPDAEEPVADAATSDTTAARAAEDASPTEATAAVGPASQATAVVEAPTPATMQVTSSSGDGGGNIVFPLALVGASAVPALVIRRRTKPRFSRHRAHR